MKIGYATSDWAMTVTDEHGQPTIGGAGYYRCEVPARALAKVGHNTVVGRLVGKPSGELAVKTWGGELHDGLDVIVLQRWMGEELPRDIRSARANGQAVVNDLDDWFWGLAQSNRAFWSSHPKVSPTDNRDHYRSSLLASTALTVSTPYLAERVGRAGVPTFVLRNAIDLERWTPQEVREPGQLVIGWVGATSHRSGDLETLRGVLGPWLASHDALFRHSGHNNQIEAAHDQAWIEPGRTLVPRGMAPIGEYPGLFAGIDVGIVPLADVPFNHAKSSIKGMEYAAAGIPFIAQALPEYQTFLAAACARRPRDWLRLLDRMTDPTYRGAAREAGLLAVAQQDIAVRAFDWSEAYRHILSGMGSRQPAGAP